MNRHVIRITAADSPNVARGLAQAARGEAPDHLEVTPGVLSYAQYLHRLATWDADRVAVGILAQWYEGPELKLYPRDWLEAVIRQHNSLGPPGNLPRYMGVDPAEGGDRSAWVVLDATRMLDMVSEKTPDTNGVYFRTLDLMQRWSVRPENVILDRGSGKQHADRLAMNGHPVRTLAFGEAVTLPIKSGRTPIADRREVREDQSLYRNRRTELYWEGARYLFREPGDGVPFAIPRAMAEWAPVGRKSLRAQLQAVPKLYDEHGRPFLPPKNRPAATGEATTVNRRVKPLVELVGHSPDEAEAFLLALHALLNRPVRTTASVS